MASAKTTLQALILVIFCVSQALCCWKTYYVCHDCGTNGCEDNADYGNEIGECAFCAKLILPSSNARYNRFCMRDYYIDWFKEEVGCGLDRYHRNCCRIVSNCARTRYNDAVMCNCKGNRCNSATRELLSPVALLGLAIATTAAAALSWNKLL